MERFLSRATILMLLVVVGIMLAIPIAGQLVFTDMLPERWRIEHWPLWLQIPFGAIVLLYIIADLWFTIRRPGKPDRKEDHSALRSQNGRPSA